MYSFKTICIALFLMSSLVLGLELISLSDDLQEGKINILYIFIAMAAVAFVMVYVIFVVLFIKHIWYL